MSAEVSVQRKNDVPIFDYAMTRAIAPEEAPRDRRVARVGVTDDRGAEVDDGRESAFLDQ